MQQFHPIKNEKELGRTSIDNFEVFKADLKFHTAFYYHAKLHFKLFLNYFKLPLTKTPEKSNINREIRPVKKIRLVTNLFLLFFIGRETFFQFLVIKSIQLALNAVFQYQ